MEAYFLSHNGLGDNITSISAVKYLLRYYNKIHFLCKDIYLKNVELLFLDLNVNIIAFDKNNEYYECEKIIKQKYNDKNIDIFICGCHKYYLHSKITNKLLLEYIPNNKNYKIKYNFIENFYKDINLDLSIYFEYFNIPITQNSVELYNIIKNYNIIFTHTKSSTKTINIDHLLKEYIDDDNTIIICANQNIYNMNHNKYSIAEKFVNLLVAYYINIILNANIIYVIDSCFSCIILPLKETNKLNAKIIDIIER
jgi:hypothetical protein